MVNINDRGIARDTRLTCAQLARILGPRKGGRPTKPDTVRDWMLHGRQGIRLPSVLEVLVRVTTWGDYLDWLRRVGEARERERLRRKEAVQAVRTRSKRAERARQRLQEQGAI